MNLRSESVVAVPENCAVEPKLGKNSLQLANVLAGVARLAFLTTDRYAKLRALVERNQLWAMQVRPTRTARTRVPEKLVPPESWANRTLLPQVWACCSRARVCLDRRSETQIFVDPAAFLVPDVLNRVTPPIKPDQNLATRGEEHGILLVLI
jgi:hypothetical protein